MTIYSQKRSTSGVKTLRCPVRTPHQVIRDLDLRFAQFSCTNLPDLHRLRYSIPRGFLQGLQITPQNSHHSVGFVCADSSPVFLLHYLYTWRKEIHLDEKLAGTTMKTFQAEFCAATNSWCCSGPRIIPTGLIRNPLNSNKTSKVLKISQWQETCITRKTAQFKGISWKKAN